MTHWYQNRFLSKQQNKFYFSVKEKNYFSFFILCYGIMLGEKNFVVKIKQWIVFPESR